MFLYVLICHFGDIDALTKVRKYPALMSNYEVPWSIQPDQGLDIHYD